MMTSCHCCWRPNEHYLCCCSRCSTVTTSWSCEEVVVGVDCVVDADGAAVVVVVVAVAAFD